MKAIRRPARKSTEKKPQPPPKYKRTHLALALAILTAALLLTYANSLHGPFVFDNQEIILKDARIHETGPVQLHRILAGQYWETRPTGLYRPLVTLSYLFNYSILGNGANSEGYHWLNLILHIVNAGLVFALGLILFEETAAALLLSLLWGLHPVLTESVTNIVGRADLLAAFGVLAPVLCHHKALQASGARRAAWVGAMAIAAAVGIFSKESAIVVLAIVPLWDWLFEHGAGRRRAVSYAAVAVPCAAFLWARSRVIADAMYLGTQFGDNPLLGADFWTARMTAMKVIAEYARVLLWPARLSWDYSYNEIPLFRWQFTNWEDWKAILAVIGCVAAAALAIRFWRRRPVLFGVAFFFITLAPVSNVFLRIGTIMAERFLYLPAVGAAICAVYGLWAIWGRIAAQGRYRRAALAAMTAVLFAFGVRAAARNGDWVDENRFWQSGVYTAPGSYKTHINAATHMALRSQDDVDAAVREVERALSIVGGLPDDLNAPNAYRDAGAIYRAAGDMSAAKTDPSPWYRKSLDALLKSERLEQVWDQKMRQENAKRGRTGVTTLPARLYLELGRTYERLANPGAALAAFEKGRMLASDPDLLEDLASAYASNGNPRGAIVALVEALSVDPSRAQLNAKLVKLYEQTDPSGCAVVHQGGESILNVECPLVHGDICAASRNVMQNYLRRSQRFEADAIRRTATVDLGCAPALLQ